jgi:hypothetical protein
MSLLLCSLLLLSAGLGAAGVPETSVCDSVRSLGERTKVRLSSAAVASCARTAART